MFDLVMLSLIGTYITIPLNLAMLYMAFRVIQNKEYVSRIYIALLFINSLIWTIYGLLSTDFIMFSSNLFGVIGSSLVAKALLRGE